MKHCNTIKARARLCAIVPLLYPIRLLQSMLGFPVDMGELHYQIGDVWRGASHNTHKGE